LTLEAAEQGLAAERRLLEERTQDLDRRELAQRSPATVGERPRAAKKTGGDAAASKPEGELQAREAELAARTSELAGQEAQLAYVQVALAARQEELRRRERELDNAERIRERSAATEAERYLSFSEGLDALVGRAEPPRRR
jgi:uncharacterized protein (DUF3084 family)